MKRQFSACQTPRGIYPSIFNSFPVIRDASAKKSQFSRTAAHIFLFPTEASLRLSRNVLHGWKDNSMLVKPLAACTYLSSTVSKLFEPQVQKIAIFTYRSPHFCFPWGRPWGNHAKCCMDGKKFYAYKFSCSMYPSIFNSFPVIRTASSKNRHFHVPQPTFLFPLEAPLRLSRNMLQGWKDNSMLAKRLAASTYLSLIASELYDA